MNEFPERFPVDSPEFPAPGNFTTRDTLPRGEFGELWGIGRGIGGKRKKSLNNRIFSLFLFPDSPITPPPPSRRFFGLFSGARGGEPGIVETDINWLTVSHGDGSRERSRQEHGGRGYGAHRGPRGGRN